VLNYISRLLGEEMDRQERSDFGINYLLQTGWALWYIIKVAVSAADKIATPIVL